MESNIQQYSVENWIKKLNALNAVFLTEKENFSQELGIISKRLKLLETQRITIAFVGQSKAGKSMILNALIGKKLVQSHEHNCTFFGLKIQPCDCTPVLFTKEMQKEQWIIGEDEVQKKIEEINKEERYRKKTMILEGLNSKKNENIWTLQTFMKAFERDNTKYKLKEELRFLEFCDLPGISDDILNFNVEEMKNNMETIAVYEEKRMSGKNVENRQFNHIFSEINPQILILVMDVNNMKDIESFIDYFKQSLFKGKKRGKIKQIMENNNFIILINKADDIKSTTTKKDVLETIFQKFSVITEFQNKNLKEEKSDDFFKRVNVFFVSSKIALESVYFTEELETKLRDIYIKLKKDSEFIEKAISQQKEKFKNQTDYKPTSNFEDFLENLQNKIKEVFSEQIAKSLEEDLMYLEDTKNSFLGKKDYLQDNSSGFLQENIRNSFFETQSTKLLKVNESQINLIINKVCEKLNENTNILSKYDKSIIKEKYFDFVDSCSEAISTANEHISENFQIYANEISNIFKPTPKFQAFLNGKIVYIIKNCEKKLKGKKDENLYGFLPNDITYFRHWIFRKIATFFTLTKTFLTIMEKFFAQFNYKLNKNVKMEMKENYNKHFKEPMQMIINDSLRLLKGKYA